MEVEVRFNGDDITTSVVSYNMQKKICTGVGSLEIEVVTGGSYDPWDIIEIWEYGIKKGKFFVSKILDTLETGVTTLSCLDNVKRIQDYYITESYLIDYPSTCKYWIEKFLTEAGVEYEFTVSGSGSLLSNNTSLGLSQAYDNIMTLLQMSGWYMYFDDDGIAIIGKLSTEIGDITESYSKSDIIDIKVDQNDNMLRNRVVVWGNQDPITQQWVFADVRHPTPWDYDSNDLRTLLISNSNIPDVANAYSLATIGISEFAKITVEKHLTIAGTCLADLGDIVYVDSDIYSGTGLVTSIGSSMSKEGLTTLMILDERCPRLFGFFNFGDYVYIGTLEDGVWRKHLKLLTSWTNYSTGLLNKRISDLHINNGVASLVTVSGDLYQSKLIDNYWTKTNIGDLESYVEDNPAESENYEIITFPGIKGRATILDKSTNNIRYAVDNWSGSNWTNQKELYSEDFMPVSGESFRSWILDKNPSNNTFNNYPINISGDYNIRAIDLENDGVNDYVSVIGSGVSGWYGRTTIGKAQVPTWFQVNPLIYWKYEGWGDPPTSSNWSMQINIRSLGPAGFYILYTGEDFLTASEIVALKGSSTTLRKSYTFYDGGNITLVMGGGNVDRFIVFEPENTDEESQTYLITAYMLQDFDRSWYPHEIAMLEVHSRNSAAPGSMALKIWNYNAPLDDNYTEITYPTGDYTTVDVIEDGFYYVLQRNIGDFAIVDFATHPIRLDISTYAPLIDVRNVEATFKSFYINKSEAIVLGMDVTLEGMQRDVNDFRYCSFLTSGDYTGKDIVYTNEDDIYRINIDTMANPTIYSTISGQQVDKIETTNYCPSGQYIFVSTSGGTPLFYQKNPELPSFASYSTNLPDSRITIIRIDDRI